MMRKRRKRKNSYRLGLRFPEIEIIDLDERKFIAPQPNIIDSPVRTNTNCNMLSRF